MGSAYVLQADAAKIPLRDESVDCIVTSPPYFALRSYQDAGEHYDGQIGSEATPQDFLEALWKATEEMVRVLKPSGSIFVNLGDKYAGSGGHNNSNISRRHTQPLEGGRGKLAEMDANEAAANEWKASRRTAPDRYNQETGGIPAKSLMGLPWRYAIGCIDHLGLILREEIIWSKPNGLPESVTDRCRRSHEQWFHFTKQGRYFAAIDEIREAHASSMDGVKMSTRSRPARQVIGDDGMRASGLQGHERVDFQNPLGKLPGSVWTIPTEPLKVPPELEVDHFAAFPTEWPRRFVLGFSPSGICVKCGEGRKPVVDKKLVGAWHDKPPQNTKFAGAESAHLNNRKSAGDRMMETFGSSEATIVGYACACTPYTDHPEHRGKSFHASGSDAAAGHSANGSERNKAYREGEAGPKGAVREYHLEGWEAPATRPAVVLDPFSGTGTVAMVAEALGRTGIGVDLSHDYCRLAKWRCEESNHDLKVIARTHGEAAAKGEKKQREAAAAGQTNLFEEAI